MMEKIQISKVRVLLPIFFVGLLFLTPFLSTSMRSSYILNLLIVFLGLEAGLLSSTPKSLDESEKYNILNTTEATCTTTSLVNTRDASVQPLIVLIEQTAKQEMVKKDAMKRCKSRPSIFFIGSHDLDIESAEKNEEVIIVKEMEAKIIPTNGVEKEKGEEISKHELNMMAETFIGNFYKQLKVEWTQRRKFQGKLNENYN